MSSELAITLALFLAAVGVVLIVDLVLVWRSDPSAVSGPERAQLAVAVAIAAFVGSFFLGRGIDEGGAAEPVAVEPEPAALVDDSWVGSLAIAARLPNLRPQETPQRRGEQRKPKPGSPSPSEPAASAADTPDSSAPPPDTEPPSTPPTAPVAEPTPAPEPAPEPEPEPPPSFNDFG